MDDRNLNSQMVIKCPQQLPPRRIFEEQDNQSVASLSSECGSTICVRDMVRMYDNRSMQTPRHSQVEALMCSNRSHYYPTHKVWSSTTIRPIVAASEDTPKTHSHSPCDCKCYAMHKDTHCGSCPNNAGRHSVKEVCKEFERSKTYIGPPTKRCPHMEPPQPKGNTKSSSQQTSTVKISSPESFNALTKMDKRCERSLTIAHSSESTYDSRTTIAKTKSGIRIVIDIMLDNVHYAPASDIIGTHVETDLPASQILTQLHKGEILPVRTTEL